MTSQPSALRFGSNVVELLLPQKRPFLMVDFVSDWSADPPRLHAGRQISSNEWYFDGHFPGMHIWPGTLTIEGLGQTSALLMAVIAMRRAATELGVDPDIVLSRLANLDRGFRMHPAHNAADALDLVGRIRAEPPYLAIGASVNVKFLRPVFAGQRLDYVATLSGEMGNMMRFDVQALVDGTPVVEGTLSGARIARSSAVAAAFG